MPFGKNRKWLKRTGKVGFARVLRKEMALAEKILWEALRNQRLCGFKFRRQAPIDAYIVDFLCWQHKLILEVDGGIHEQQKEYDQLRRRVFERKKFPHPVFFQ